MNSNSSDNPSDNPSDSKPSVFEIKSSIKKIKTIIKNIELKGITRPADKEDYFWKNHPDMMNRFVFLISQLCSNSDNQMLDIMIKQLEEIEKGKISSNDADKKIGEKLATAYLPK
jgi:hypothetical protein